MGTPATPPPPRGFTLVELLIACSMTTVILLLAARAFSGASTLWHHAVSRGETFREARAACDILARDLAAAVPAPDSTAPMLVLDHQPATPEADRFNEEVYAAILAPNPGKSTLCLVGYRVVWNPERRCYTLRRTFKESNATFAAFRDAAGSASPFEALHLAGPAADEEVAACVWDLTIRPCEEGAAASYPKRSYSAQFPASVEVRFKAVGTSAARKFAALPITRETWRDPDDPLYRRAILPHQQSFVFRVRLQTALPTP